MRALRKGTQGRGRFAPICAGKGAIVVASLLENPPHLLFMAPWGRGGGSRFCDVRGGGAAAFRTDEAAGAA